MTNLWDQNVPEKFWLCNPPISAEFWHEAIQEALPKLGFEIGIDSVDELLELTLGEGRFGPTHWNLSFLKRLYYSLKPVLPRFLTRSLRRYYSNPNDEKFKVNWPVDTRYVFFQWEVLRQLLISARNEPIYFERIWPQKDRFAFVLTHDIETVEGQAFVRDVAKMEEELGFRSSFNFVLDRYKLDENLIYDLRESGFEVGCHGLKHDGKLFNSRAEFSRRVKEINKLMRKYAMVGFRSPLTHRNPEWMQELDIEYDLSFFDTDPFEPVPGGAMSIWPHFIGHFVELPYTLVQDYTLTSILGETSPRIWLEKVDFIEKYRGLALLNSHPDYLKEKNTWDVYYKFLSSMRKRDGYWHALPRDVARWWRNRNTLNFQNSTDERNLAVARLDNGVVRLED